MRIDKQPVITVKTEPYVAKMYLDKFWVCSYEERKRILEDIEKYGIIDEDYPDEFDIEVDLDMPDEKLEHLPSHIDYIAASEFINQNGMHKDIKSDLQVDTGRYINITIEADD